MPQLRTSSKRENVAVTKKMLKATPCYDFKTIYFYTSRFVCVQAHVHKLKKLSLLKNGLKNYYITLSAQCF